MRLASRAPQSCHAFLSHAFLSHSARVHGGGVDLRAACSVAPVLCSPNVL